MSGHALKRRHQTQPHESDLTQGIPLQCPIFAQLLVKRCWAHDVCGYC